MALIDFKCKSCGNEFFEIVKAQDEKVICPKCSSEEVERLYKGKYFGKGSCSGNCSGGCSGCK
jgi:putative FmdB family regulatory protein